MESKSNTPIEHQNVPSAHQGLHNLLYSGEDEHSVNKNNATVDFDGSSIVEVCRWQSLIESTKVAGVYAVLNSDRIYQYIGYSRDVLRSVRGHITQNGEQVCAFIRLKTFKFPKRQEMETLKDEWLAELNYIPIGNQDGSGKWAKTIKEAAQATMTDVERAIYEEKKFKLRKAMADATLADESTEGELLNKTDVQRRQELEAAIKNDDWSSLIDS